MLRKKTAVKRKFSFSVALIVLMSIATRYTLFEVYAPATPALSIARSSIVDLTLVAGKSFYVNVTVSNVTNILGYQFFLSFNTSVLTAANYTALSPFTHQLAAEINDRSGYVAASYDISPPSGFTGTQAVLKIGFKVDYLGESNLDLYDTRMWDLVGASIVHSVNDGYFRNVASPSIPTASFTMNNTNPLEGQAIRFDASASTGGPGSITKYSWDFGEDIRLTPDGNGTYTAWTGGYRDWDDPLDVHHDSDDSTVSTKTTNVNESSTLANPPTLQTVRDHTIRGVRLTVVARNFGGSDEKLRAMLVIGGKGYNGTLSQPASDYVGPSSVIVSDWATNPATAVAWTWANIDSLEAGVRSQRTGAAFNELRVTQLYVTVLITTVDYTAPTSTADYYYRYRGNYTARLDVYNNLGAVSSTKATVNVRGHDVALTKFTYGGYKLLRPVADGTYNYWTGSYQDWDEWPNPDEDTTYVATSGGLVLRPNGDGTYTDWFGSYTEWDEWPTRDLDATKVFANATTGNNKRETSTLQDHTTETWPIEKVRLNIVARNPIHTSNERLEPILVIGGNTYSWPSFIPSRNYRTYSFDWLTNPATGLPWTWSDVDTLEAGVRSVQRGSTWTGELRVTQLYVTVVAGEMETSALENHTTETWDIEKVRITAVARNPVISNEKLSLMLIIDGKTYNSRSIGIGTTYSARTYEYFTNPITGMPWTWFDIDTLEAGVRAKQFGSVWTGELRVTQLYAEVFGYAPPGLYTGEYLPPMWTTIKALPQETMKFWVTIENQGNFAESGFEVTLCRGSTPIGTQTVSSLNVGAAVRLEFTWTVDAPYNSTFIVSVKTSTITGENDAADNIITACKYGGLTRDAWVKVKLAGDANGDGFVNSLDIGKLNSHWSPAAGTPAWSKGYSFTVDPNEDGYINSLDMGVVNLNWGTKYP
jgi:hypothetical protein